MQTKLHPDLTHNAQAQRASDIISACVHCGFCTAHCPTYQHLGDERDGPRGRIYLIKQMLEENAATEKTTTHLDRCLTCRACETICPAGVEYGELAHIGKSMAKTHAGTLIYKKILTTCLSYVLPYKNRVSLVFGIGRIFKPLLPKKLSKKIPPSQDLPNWPAPRHKRRMLILEGCATAALTPRTNYAAARVLDRLGISLIVTPRAGCCGAVDHHMGFEEQGLNAMRSNIDAWWSHIEEGCEAILITASACSLQVKEYAKLLKDDPIYGDKASKISALAKDISEVLEQEDIRALSPDVSQKIAVHCPCTLQHGQNGAGVVASLLNKLGVKTTKTQNDHLCCGSAGTYSLQQPEISEALLKNKVRDLSGEHPDMIVTSNIGCQLHISTGTDKPVKHWIELLDDISREQVK